MPPTETARTLLLILPFTAQDSLDPNFQMQKLTELRNGIKENFSVVYICDDIPQVEQLSSLEKIKKHFKDVIFVSHGKNRGKGAALKTGMQLSTNYAHALYTDIDFPYTIESMSNVYRVLKEDTDFVIGVRRRVEEVSYPLWQRRSLSNVLRFLNRILIGKDWEDTQAGLKAYSSRACSIFQFLSYDRYLFDWQCVRHASKAKDISVKQVDVKLREDYSQKFFSLSNFFKECVDVVSKLLKSMW